MLILQRFSLNLFNELVLLIVVNGTIKLIQSNRDRQSHKDQGIVEIYNQIRFSARLVLMQNYLLELTIKLCLDHETLVCSFAPEFPGGSLFTSLICNTAQQQTQQQEDFITP